MQPDYQRWSLCLYVYLERPPPSLLDWRQRGVVCGVVLGGLCCTNDPRHCEIKRFSVASVISESMCACVRVHRVHRWWPHASLTWSGNNCLISRPILVGGSLWGLAVPGTWRETRRALWRLLLPLRWADEFIASTLAMCKSEIYSCVGKTEESMAV